MEQTRNRPPEQTHLASALGKIVSGVYIVTTGAGGQRSGMLASWVMQVGFEPPRVTVAIQQDRDILARIRETGCFVLNVVGQDQPALMGTFAQYRPDAFDRHPAEDTAYGVVLTETVATLGCRVVQEWVAGDHVVLLADVETGHLLSETMSPWTHVRKNGFSY